LFTAFKRTWFAARLANECRVVADGEQQERNTAWTEDEKKKKVSQTEKRSTNASSPLSKTELRGGNQGIKGVMWR